ncbi:hypothetical protein EAF00_011265 [Botryotinia globosa]|nr:hypothetical protein EAF00_011265 [Botryotinia globosa]
MQPSIPLRKPISPRPSPSHLAHRESKSRPHELNHVVSMRSSSPLPNSKSIHSSPSHPPLYHKHPITPPSPYPTNFIHQPSIISPETHFNTHTYPYRHASQRDETTQDDTRRQEAEQYMHL